MSHQTAPAVVQIMVEQLESLKRPSAAAAEDRVAVLVGQESQHAAQKPEAQLPEASPKTAHCGLRAWYISADFPSGMGLGLAPDS